jgi:hypothetical protein
MSNQPQSPKKEDIRIKLFKTDLKTANQQKAFESIYQKNNGDWSAIKSELSDKEVFEPALVSNLEFTHRLAEWSSNNQDLIPVFKQDDRIRSIRDIAATFNKTAFIDKVKAYAPAETDEDKRVYALNLHRQLFNLEPTVMLINMIKDPQVPILNGTLGANVAAVLEKHAEFNIKTTSIYEIIQNEETIKDIPAENQEMVISQLKTLQRIAAVIPDTDALPVLYNKNMHSAMHISAMPKAQFIAAMSGSGLDDNTLQQVHTNAQQARVRNEQAIIALREAYKGTGVAMIDKSINMSAAEGTATMNLRSGVKKGSAKTHLEETVAKHNLSWDLLFGDADLCECSECNSVYSAAAYFVELLQYLRNNNLNPAPVNPIPIQTDPKDISGTPLEKLFDRRPDLGCLELTCKNIHTVLPYIDLVNEVMENYVAFKHLKPFNVEDETSSELLAEPQHTEYQAYCILKNEVYPFTLPYHQPIDAERIYLQHLDTSRYELIHTFRKNNSDPDADLTILKDAALDRAADAEFLGLTKEQYVILTKECFESKDLIDKLKNKVHTDDEYRQLIGVKPVHKYFGYDDESTMLGDEGLTLIKQQFLRRTGIDYFNLVILLTTGYINPLMPKGKSKAIMESLHFSYRYLQNYAKVHGIDKMAEHLVKSEKLAELIPKLKEAMDSLTNKKEMHCPDPNLNVIEITDKDIMHWVKCHFEQVGKMIVIESGRGCVDGKIVSAMDVRSNREIAVIEDCKIYLSVIEDELIEVGSVDRKTGLVTLQGDQSTTDPSVWKEMTFIGDKGGKGVFWVIGNQLYLIFLEQKDSCDLDTALLQHLDGSPLTIEEYDRIHRFIRLWRKLDWTMDELDRAIIGLSSVTTASLQDHHSEESLCEVCGDDGCHDCDDCEDNKEMTHADINPQLLHQLTAVKRLLDKSGVELIKLLSFWTPISTTGEKSLYQRLFLTHNIVGIDSIFKADDKGNYLTADVKLSEHVPVVMASLNLSADDIQTIMQATEMDDKLTLSNLSILYRYRLLSKVLGLRIPDFIRILPLFGDMFENAHTTLEFMGNWGKMGESGFTYRQLNYLIRNTDDEKKPFAPAQRIILQLSKLLYDGLNAIDETHKDLAADGSITDPTLQKVNIQEQVTSELLRSKISLLFDTGTVEKIIGIMEGSNVFTTNAPKNVEVTISDANTLVKKLKYDKTLGAIHITGILTESETFDFNNMNGSSDWAKTLIRIQKQQDKLFKELLSGVFENEQTKTFAVKTQLEAIIKLGDISISLDQIPEGEADPNTAPQKRVAFLDLFLPYLRQQLTHRLVVDTLSNLTGLSAKITDVLISQVLKQGDPAVPIYRIFEKIKESAKPDESNWSSYLIPAADTSYTLIIKNSDSKPNVSIDGVPLDFTAQEDPTNEWWSVSIPLQSGKLVKLAAAGVDLKQIYWKTPSSAITSIPSSALLPDFASKQCEPALIALQKVAMLVSVFDLSEDEVQFLDLHKAEFGELDFNALTFMQWLRLEAYARLRNSLPQAKLNLLEFWKWVFDAASDKTKLVEKLVDLTAWKKERVEKLIAANHFNMGELADFRNEINLLKLQQALTVADKIGVDLDLLFHWAVPTSKFNTRRKIAESIKNAIRAKYNQTEWEQVVKPLHDQLRNHQKEALIDYLLQQKELIDWNVTDADGLFEYFLIDVQMEPCMETSRIKQAISSVQLFVQRCFLGLEEAYNGIQPDILDRQRWDWMQRYRVWEANRKVFLYPENWIESQLRDDKSPFFKELESELLQKDINKQNVVDALKSYLYKMDEVANLEVVGLYIHGTRNENMWSKNARMHVFSRTRNAPYHFYYRYLALDEMNWYPWEKMQIDIPSYDVENPSTHEVTGNGCYLTPVVWNERMLIFFPQIMKKTKPNPSSTSGSFSSIGNDSDGISKSSPIEYYEIKLAWSEYRNGKWTQKQISKDAVCSDPRDSTNDVQYFKFVPIVYANRIVIDFDDNLDSNGTFKDAFEFDGTALKKASASVSTEAVPINYFNQNNGRLYSWQIDSSSLVRQNTEIYFYEDSFREKMKGFEPYQSEFHHPVTKKLLGTINIGQLELFFQENLALSVDNFGPFDHDESYETPDIYHELKRPYSLYNWELFFHTPILLADALSKAQQFEEAMKWFHFVFNPIADGNDDNRFWQFQPFKLINGQRILDSIFNNLKPNTANQTINEWRNKPFMPHVVARSRPVAYMKWIVMKYIDNLLAWGDYLFRQDTIESINQATQLYVLAGHILGPRPMTIPKRGKVKPQTYLGLLDKWDAFGNAMVELELAAPFSNQTPLPAGIVNNELAFANIYGLASSFYFCIPNNPKLMGYWDTLADRLYKIRHCLNMEGVFRKLPLFEPPIDPALLVRAAAQGLSIASVLNDLNTPLPNYRFYYLLQKALELCGELKSLGGAMLSAIEKKDNESIALIRAKHEGVMQSLMMEIKKKQLEEAQKNLESLLQNRRSPEARMRYYLKQSGLDESLMPADTAEFNGIPNDIVTVDGESGLKLIPFEKEDMEKASAAADWQIGIGAVETLASVFHALPSMTIDGKPFGVGAGVLWGFPNLANATSAVGRGLRIYSDYLSYQSTSAGKKGGFSRALQERIFQANAAGYELKQIDKQITAQMIRIDIANQEIANQQKAIDNANEVEEFIKNKYSSEELYTWMRGSLKTLYHQVYNLTYDLAKKAEKTYCFERGVSSSSFIQSGYFDAGRDGLLAGEQLYVGLKQLEAAYQNERGYDYEITKTVSLYQINPLAVIQLRETGKCEFELPEVIFDMDYPGHYKRRIKSVSLSIPCIAGPYTGINATLSVLENKFRNTAIGGKAYEENTEETDDRFSSYAIPINAIAASSGQNDSGVFELNFKDERYLPFEGAGVISRWRLELPPLRQFDYRSIAEVSIQLKYTACEGGERLKAAAIKSLTKRLESMEQELNETGLHVALNMKHDLSQEWYLLKKNGTVDLKVDKARLPYMAQAMEAEIESVLFVAKVKGNPVTFTLNIDGSTIPLNRVDDWKICRGSSSDIALGKAFTLSVEPAAVNLLEELFMIVKYSF